MRIAAIGVANFVFRRTTTFDFAYLSYRQTPATPATILQQQIIRKWAQWQAQTEKKKKTKSCQITFVGPKAAIADYNRMASNASMRFPNYLLVFWPTGGGPAERVARDIIIISFASLVIPSPPPDVVLLWIGINDILVDSEWDEAADRVLAGSYSARSVPGRVLALLSRCRWRKAGKDQTRSARGCDGVDRRVATAYPAAPTTSSHQQREKHGPPSARGCGGHLSYVPPCVAHIRRASSQSRRRTAGGESVAGSNPS